MLKRTLLIVVLLRLLTLVTSCASQMEIRLCDDDEDRLIELDKGQVLVIALTSNPSTGYKWEEVKHDEYILQKIGETEFESQPDLVGAPGVEIFRFKAVNTGQGALKLVYHRFWEKDVQPQRTFSLKVLVR